MCVELPEKLIEALKQLYAFRSQPHIVGTVVDIISAFFKNPNLIRTSFKFHDGGSSRDWETTLAGIIATCSRRGCLQIVLFVQDVRVRGRTGGSNWLREHAIF